MHAHISLYINQYVVFVCVLVCVLVCVFVCVYVCVCMRVCVCVRSPQEALKTAQEMETKLEEEQEVCNDTIKALWEECKPCLKNTCIKFYSRTCSSGAALVGRQVVSR